MERGFMKALHQVHCACYTLLSQQNPQKAVGLQYGQCGGVSGSKPGIAGAFWVVVVSGGLLGFFRALLVVNCQQSKQHFPSRSMSTCKFSF